MIARMTSAFLMLACAVTLARDAHAERGARRRAHREEMTRLIDEYLMEKIQKRLDLTPQQYTQIAPLIKKLQGDRRNFARRRFEALRKMRRLLMRGGATEQEITAIVRELQDLEAEAPITLQKDMRAIDAVLSPVQQAKYRVLEFEVERRIGDLRRRAHRRREGHMLRPQEPGSPGEPGLSPTPTSSK
jgi:Spy/CpxP family protein refolding chaperone